MGLHYRSSHRRPFAIPVGQGRLRQRYIARRKLIYIFEESPPSVPINGAVLRIMNKLKRLWNRSEEHTSELQSRGHLVCRLLLEKKKNSKLQNDRKTPHHQ